MSLVGFSTFRHFDRDRGVLWNDAQKVAERQSSEPGEQPPATCLGNQRCSVLGALGERIAKLNAADHAWRQAGQISRTAA